MTSATTPRAERPGYRPFVTTVTGIAELSPHYVCVTLRGDTLSDFAPHGLDQRIKIVVPFDDGTVTDVGFDDETVLAAGSWYARWRELPDERRIPVRTYTVRAIRPERGEIDVDVVRHAAAPGTTLGPAARWIARAGIGDTLIVAGPDVRSPQSHIGIDWHPGDATRVLIAGDETAVPAALGILEALPAGVRADVLLEIPSSADALPVRTSADVRVTWLARDAADAPASSSAPGTPDDASVGIVQWRQDSRLSGLTTTVGTPMPPAGPEREAALEAFRGLVRALIDKTEVLLDEHERVAQPA